MSLSSQPQSYPVNHSSIRSAYDRLFSGQEQNASYSVLSTLRAIYPDHHVTRIDFNDCDLLDFADAGHAKAGLLDAVNIEREYTPAPPVGSAGYVDDPASPDDLDDMNYFMAGRQKARPAVDGDGGDRLDDDVNFGLYAYQWNGMDFLVYRHVFAKPFSSTQQKYFILSPRSTGLSADGLHSLQTDELIRTVARWQAVVHDEIYVFDDGAWRKSKSLWCSVRTVSWDAVILDPRIKDALIDDVQGFFTSQALYAEFAVPWKRGVILHGVPGNGKTLSIKALMSSLYASSPAPDGSRRAIPSLYVKSLQNCNGPQYAIRSIFRKARKCAPCMLIFEDLDSVVTDKVRSYFLNEVDGLEANNGILMIGSTNHLVALDPAIANRPSRFDRKYHFALPRLQERAAYANYWRRKLERNEKVEFPDQVCELVAEWTSGFSFAYLKELFISALLTVARGGSRGEKEVKSDGSTTVDKNYVVVSGSDALSTEGSSSQENKATSSSQEAPELETEPNIKIPEMIIPDGLKDNVLLQVLRQQVEALLREMDNSKTASDGEKKKGGDDGEESDLAQQILMMRRAQACQDC